MNSPLILALISLLAVAFGWLAAHWLGRKGAAEYAVVAKRLDEISSLPIEEAASRALPLLSNGRLFRTITGTPEDTRRVAVLAPELRSVLNRYETIESNTASRAVINRSVLGPSSRPGFLRIGEIGEGTDVTGEIAVRPGKEAIYELYADDPIDEKFGTYTSIYHWLLAMADEVETAALS